MMQRAFWPMVLLSVAWAQADPIDIGSRRELLVDDFLIDSLQEGAALQLHHPTPKDLALVHDAPWEGSGTGYHTVFQDGDIYRMYYKAWDLAPQQGKLETPHETFGAYAESSDGIHWEKPNLGLFEFAGSKDNNIVWIGKGSHDFTPFKDTNPACPPEERYKAIGYGPDPTGAYAMVSPDGIHWTMMQDAPILTDGKFDTQNLAFWDAERGEYRAYIRDFVGEQRGIKTATSKDFRAWSELQWLEYTGAPAEEQLYTNQVKPYFRAPHLYIGFPARYVERPWDAAVFDQLANPDHRALRASSTPRYGSAITDGVFMTSRDGLHFHRWGEAFLRPGLRKTENWAYGDNYIAWHVVETKSDMPDGPNELSIYATESYWTDHQSALRRYTLRMDGFVSVNAPLTGGSFTTKPITFSGHELVLNMSTSAGGSIRIEVQREDGSPIEGFTLADCLEIFGDDLERVVRWKQGPDLSALAGMPVRLHVTLRDADLFAFQFRE